jgi:radical SAM superfamily enzyme YgiQ (UPF0313 family)
MVDARAPVDTFQLRVKPAAEPSSWLFHVKDRAVSLAVGPREVITFDREGRPFAAYLDGRNYRRGLDGRILEKTGQTSASRLLRPRRVLDAREADAWVERVLNRVGQLAAAAGADPEAVPPAQFAGWVRRLQRWTAASLADHAGRFSSVYRSVSVLPPDQYLALVVQTTEGCPWNRCTFCDLYRDRPYRLKSGVEVGAHLDAILDFLGEAIRLRRSVFLGDASMLASPQSALLAAIDQIRARLAGVAGPSACFYGFADVVGVGRRDRGDLVALRQAGVRRLYLGLETGDDTLRRLLGKQGDVRTAVEMVRLLHEAGIAVGVVVLLGVGGSTLAPGHETGTVAALEAMGLNRQDVVYWSPLIEHDQRQYREQAAGSGWLAMGPEEMAAQRRRLEASLRFGSSPPLLSRYDLRDFIY